jgi:DDE superfamily endonuclease
VLCVNEKPSIQALERAQGYLKLPNGRALTGQSHDYKRHGTTTLFAALEVATGKIIATHSKRRLRVEFLDFMNGITAAFPNRKLHVILDNLNTRKKNEHWAQGPSQCAISFHTDKCLLAQPGRGMVSILQGQSLSGASFTSLKQLEQHIDAYIKAYTTKLSPSSGPRKKSVNAASKAAVSLSFDSGYERRIVRFGLRCSSGSFFKHPTRLNEQAAIDRLV